MHRFICRETRTLSPPKYLMIDCKTMLETRKGASFYTKKEKVDQLKNALKQGKFPETDEKFGEMFSIRFSNRMGKQCLPWDRDWHWACEDALVIIHHNDNLVLDIENVIQTMEGDSVTAAINKYHILLEAG